MEEQVSTKGKKSKPVTVFSAVQRERSRPFQRQVLKYQKKLQGEERRSEAYKKIPFKMAIGKGAKVFAKYSSQRLGTGFQRGLSLLQRGGTTRALYGQPVSPYGSNIPNFPRYKYTGRRGRPVGTVKYRDDQGNPIDVYTLRKLQGFKRRQYRIEQFNARAVTPQQRAVLEEFRRRELMARQNPERNIIPSTDGFVPINNILREADDYSNLVP